MSSNKSSSGGFTFNQLHTDPGHYRRMVTMRTMHLVTSMILIICNNPYTIQMSKVSPDTRDNLLTVTPCKFRKQFTSFLHTIAQHTIHILNERNGDTMRTDRPKASPKHRRKNIKSSSSKIYGALVSKGLDGPMLATSLSLITFTPLMPLTLQGRCLHL